jgi:Homeodomain-like domain
METITMSTIEQRRAWVLNRLGKGGLTTTEAAELLGLSERQVWRLRAARAALSVGLAVAVAVTVVVAIEPSRGLVDRFGALLAVLAQGPRPT